MHNLWYIYMEYLRSWERIMFEALSKAFGIFSGSGPAADSIDLVTANLQDGVVVIGKDLKINFVNKIFCQLMGKSAEQLVHLPVGNALSLMENGAISKAEDFLKPLLTNDFAVISGSRNLILPGGPVTVEINARVIPAANQIVLTIKNFPRPDTAGNQQPEAVPAPTKTPERPPADSQSEHQEVRNEAILRSIGDGLIVTDQQQKIVLINQPALEMLGYRTEEVAGRPVTEVAPIEYEQENLDPAGKPVPKSLLAYSKSSTTDFYLIKKDGTKFPAGITSSSAILNGQVIGNVILFRNISKEKDIDRAKNTFISIASHQMRTPLGSMKWNLEMLLDGDYGEIPKEAKNILEQVLDSNKRMVALVDDLLDVSRIDQGKAIDQLEMTEIVPIVSDSITEIKAVAQRKSVSLSMEIKGNPNPRVLVGPKRFREAIENLLSNAVKYSIQNGEVFVVVESSQDKVKISVADNGIGIPQKDQGRIFSRFFRADNAVRSETEGTGLGLFVVKSYAESWGGKTWFESQEGKGSTFYIEIPIKVAEEQ